jgi:AraC-like DNA-binding protein/mannose-6-phosphate isomerase-like protein (cupin superfamily)
MCWRLPGRGVHDPCRVELLRVSHRLDMRRTSLPASDVSESGVGSTFQGVRSSAAEPRSWLAGFAVNDALMRHRILHVGVARGRPLRIVRTRQTTTYFFACLDGMGEVYVDGRWRLCRPGMACLLPPHTFEAFHAVGRRPWKFCWVCYGPERVVASVASPVLARFHAEPLRHAIEGLRQECAGRAGHAIVDRWVDLIEEYVRQFAEPWRGDERVGQLWECVASRLSEAWPLERLAQAMHCSEESLRRRCQTLLGRSPGQHVIYLRMRKAAELLVTSPDKIESIALAVGYKNPFVFSTAFRRWQGCSPSDYRARRPGR